MEECNLCRSFSSIFLHLSRCDRRLATEQIRKNKLGRHTRKNSNCNNGKPTPKQNNTPTLRSSNSTRNPTPLALSDPYVCACFFFSCVIVPAAFLPVVCRDNVNLTHAVQCVRLRACGFVCDLLWWATTMSKRIDKPISSAAYAEDGCDTTNTELKKHTTECGQRKE